MLTQGIPGVYNPDTKKCPPDFIPAVGSHNVERMTRLPGDPSLIVPQQELKHKNKCNLPL